MSTKIPLNYLSKAEQTLILNEFEFNDKLFLIKVPSKTNYTLKAFHEASMSSISIENEKSFDETLGMDFYDLYGSGLYSFLDTQDSSKTTLLNPLIVKAEIISPLILNEVKALTLRNIPLLSINSIDYYLNFDAEVEINIKQVLFDHEQYAIKFEHKYKELLSKLESKEFKAKLICHLSKGVECHPLQYSICNFLVKNTRLPVKSEKDINELIELMKNKFPLASDKTRIKFEGDSFFLSSHEIWKYLQQTHMQRFIDYLINQPF